MKQIGCIALAVVISLQSGGSLFFSLVKLSMWKNEVSKDIKHIGPESSINFVFTLSEFSKIRINKKEFVVNGKLYDIVSSVVKNNEIAIIAKQDHKEDRLLVSMKNHFENLSKDGNSPLSMIIKMMSQVYIVPNQDFALVSRYNVEFNPIKYYNLYNFQYYTLIDPPPIFPLLQA